MGDRINPNKILHLSAIYIQNHYERFEIIIM